MSDQAAGTQSVPVDLGDGSNVEAPKQERGRSSIEWPYFGLDEAIRMARAVFEVGGKCRIEQLAGHVGQTTTSGGFRLKLQSTKTFGLLHSSAPGFVALTDLGSEILEGDTSEGAKIKAFLRVPLYNRLYEVFKGKSLPPTAFGLENVLVDLGVAVKQKDKARQAFHRSAKEAGFFAYGSSKLVYPVIARGRADESTDVASTEKSDHVSKTSSDERRASAAEEESLHPFVRGLLKTLPVPGTEWPIEGRRKWLQSALSIFDLIYEDSQPGSSLSISIAHLPSR